MLKDIQIHVLIQPAGSNDYWIQRLVEGIRKETQQLRKQMAAVYFSAREGAESMDFDRQPVLLAGTTAGWFADSAAYVRAHGGYPIFVNACMPPASGVSSGVFFALESAVCTCLEYLTQLGKNNPVLIGLNPSSDADHRKAAVFSETTGNPEGVYFCEQAGLEESLASCVETVLSLGADALICSNDTTAILAIACLKKHGITAGGTFPVLGMGNSFLGMHTAQSLTTVNFDYYALGREAVRLYEYQLRSGSGTQILVRIPAELIVRESTGGIPFAGAEPAVREGSRTLPDYFGGRLVSRLIMLENKLQHCDAIDREIIFGTVRGETYSQLAARLYLSERTLKYRLSHILKSLGLGSKHQLSALVQEVLGENDSV